MIVITPYSLDCQQVTGVNVAISAQTMQEAAAKLEQPIIVKSKNFILCGSGDQRYLITTEGNACGPLQFKLF